MSATVQTAKRARAGKSERAGSGVDERRRRRLSGRALVLLALVGALLVAAAYPLRAYLNERAQITSLEQRTQQLELANHKLDTEIRRLHDPNYLEHLARVCLGMVKPGEIPFVVVPEHGKGGAHPC